LKRLFWESTADITILELLIRFDSNLRLYDFKYGLQLSTEERGLALTEDSYANYPSK